MKDLQSLFDEIELEYHQAAAKFKPFNTAHEGYAVILEELDELWDEIKLRPDARRTGRIRKEAVQLAAMALRFLIDVCDKP